MTSTMLKSHVYLLPRLKFLSSYFIRPASFKVLNNKLQCGESEIKGSEQKSDLVETVITAVSDFVLSGGGSKSIHRHTVINKKLLVRHRLKLLFDHDSPFLEIGLFAGMFMDYGIIPAAGSVTGIGKIHGHYCMVGANDATVKGGTFFPITIVKQIRMQQLAYLNHLPCIYLVDSGGAFLPFQAQIFPDRDHGGRTFYNEAVLSSLRIPQIALVCGSSTAGGAYCPTMAEEAIIVKKSGVIFLGGPPLVKAATGEIVSEQDLGGADMHCSVSGCTDYFAESEEEAFAMCRESVLALNLPQSKQKLPCEEPLNSSRFLSIISGKEEISKNDMYVILASILDGSRFKEFKEKFGKCLITGFGFIHGMLVGILANYNSLTFEDSQKGTHFIQLCEKRGIPLVFLQNSGVCKISSVHMNCNENDNVGLLLKERSKMVAAHSCAKVPKITICIGSCLEDDNFTMCGWAFQPNFCFSWPLAHISSSRKDAMEAIALENTYLSKMNEMKDISKYELLFENKSSAFYHSSRMLTDGIILPEQTRQVLALCLGVLLNKTRIKADESSLAVLRM